MSRTVKGVKICRPSGTSAMPAATRLVAGGTAEIAPCKPQRSGAARQGRGYRRHQGRLAGAVRAEQRHGLALRNLQRYVIEHVGAAIAAGHVGDFKHDADLAATPPTASPR